MDETGNTENSQSTPIEQSTVPDGAPPVKKAKALPKGKPRGAVKKKRSMKRGESATSPRRIKAVEEKQLQALEYRKMAYSYAQIAEVLGYKSAQSAYCAIQSALTRIIREPAEEVLQLELERLDGMFSKPYQAAQAGDLMAIGACLNIMARKAKYLGLDVAVKVDSTVSNKNGQPFATAVVSDEQVLAAMKKAQEQF
jgi:hypothetical protein